MPVDFTSSLYLGLRHTSGSLRGWREFSSGKPAVVDWPDAARRLEVALAQSSGCADAVLGRSTLHLFHDLFALLALRPVTFFVDAAVYPVAGWVLNGVAGSRARVVSFRHLDAGSLAQAMRRHRRADSRPVVVSDGYCPLCARHAPLAAYSAMVSAAGGLLVVDDTQAFGVFGQAPDSDVPYGRGGGGSLRYCALSHSPVVSVTSLAKGLGVPVAFIGGPLGLLQKLREHGRSRMHCSPPSNADISALAHALWLNRRQGERIRGRLVRHVAYLQNRLRGIGLQPLRSVFPMQFLVLPEADARYLSRALYAGDIHTLNQRPCDGRGMTLTMILTARHRRGDLDRLLDQLRALLRPQYLTRSRYCECRDANV